jgi:hypothetical protein
MKKYLFMLSFLLLAVLIHAQGNMQFNQVIRIKNTGSISLPASINVATITVPANKVWKIESASAQLYLNITIDGQLAFYGNANQDAMINPSLPIWLSSGTYQVLLFGTASAGTIAYTTVISGLEFNIVP